ncbi:hypothetical protein GWI34_14220 [Actinomadura sp. DSM 109109]|nr:hypothetical protein [Actinomadura lepetitiana]
MDNILTLVRKRPILPDRQRLPDDERARQRQGAEDEGLPLGLGVAVKVPPAAVVASSTEPHPVFVDRSTGMLAAGVP